MVADMCGHASELAELRGHRLMYRERVKLALDMLELGLVYLHRAQVENFAGQVRGARDELKEMFNDDRYCEACGGNEMLMESTTYCWECWDTMKAEEAAEYEVDEAIGHKYFD